MFIGRNAAEIAHPLNVLEDSHLIASRRGGDGSWAFAIWTGWPARGNCSPSKAAMRLRLNPLGFAIRHPARHPIG